MPQVTVIVPTYNCSRTLRCALHTLCQQSYRDFEVWVVGDCCTDDSEQVVAAMGDERLHWTNLAQRVGRQNGPNNEGLRRAQGKYIAYLGHDDLWFPWHLETLVQTLESNKADFVYAGTIFTGPSGPVALYGDVKRNAHASPAPPPSWLHRREIVEKCGPWRAQQQELVGVDAGFQERAYRAGFRFLPSRKVSVIKFPTHWWGTYARREDFPQETYLARLEQDAATLHQEMLTRLLFDYLSERNSPSVKKGAITALQAVKHKMIAWYGVHRWPLSQYVSWVNRRHQKRSLALRGLTAGNGSV